jgi:polyisoprenoid-binding protein YceI
MHTINNVNLQGDELKPVLEAHLKSDDFFFIERFPEAVFDIEEAAPIQDGTASSPNYTVKGMLTLKGIRAGLDFLATIHALPNGRLTAEAHFDFDRTRWKIIYGSSRFFEHLGMHLVFDLISIQMKIITQ